MCIIYVINVKIYSYLFKLYNGQITKHTLILEIDNQAQLTSLTLYTKVLQSMFISV